MGQECGYDDVYVASLKAEANTTDIRITALIDADHQIVYTASNSGYFMIAPRDFTYIRTRFQKGECAVGEVSYRRIVGGMAYSVAESHPLSVQTQKDHVRGRIVMSG